MRVDIHMDGSTKFWFTFLLLAIFSWSVGGQVRKVEEILVTKVSLETSNKLTISVWTDQASVRRGDDIVVFFSVLNRGSKTIFLVSKETPSIVNDRGDVLIEAPVPGIEDWEEYDYSFHEIVPGGNYRAKFVIPGKATEKEYDVAIRTGLGFVEDITGIDRKLRRAEDPLTLRGPLQRRIETVGIGDLRILLYNP